MKKKFIVTFLAVILTAGISQAALLDLDLGLPDILSNSTGTYTYSSSTNTFTSTATPVSITFDGTTSIPITGTEPKIPATYSVSINVDSSGNFVGGASPKNELEIRGELTYGTSEYSGLLLAGEVTAFGFQDTGWNNLAIFNYTFNVYEKSLLYSFFGQKGGDVVFVENDNGWDGTWVGDHSGLKVKHDTAPIPIPATVWIFGTGLVGIVGVRRKLKS